jgi:UDP-3-O-[3-hydroxymyristoyl] glucosamine N-acyltransferase
MCQYISPTAEVADACVIGRNVVIEDEASIGRSCEIGHGTVIVRGTVIGDNVSINANSVVGRQPMSGASSSRRTSAQPPLTIGDDVVIGACTVLYAGSVIADRVMIADLATVREGCTIGNASIIGRSVTVECNTVVGARSKIQTACHLTGDMVVEEDVFFGPQVVTMNDKYMDTADVELKGPHIKSGAAVGSNSTILSGITIGEKATVGAGAIVTKDIPDGVVYISERGDRFIEKRSSRT